MINIDKKLTYLDVSVLYGLHTNIKRDTEFNNFQGCLSQAQLGKILYGAYNTCSYHLVLFFTIIGAAVLNGVYIFPNGDKYGKFTNSFGYVAVKFYFQLIFIFN